MGRRVDIQADDIGEFLGEGRVGRQLEVAPAVRAETVSLPDRLHRRGGNTGRPGHRAQRPVGRLKRRRLLRQAHDLGDTTADTLVHEPLLPAPHAGLGLAGLGHDRRGAQTLAAEKDNMCPPDVFLRALGIRDDRAQSLTVAGG